MDFLDRLDPRLAEVLPSIPQLDLADIPTARAERRELARRARGSWQPPEAVTVTDHVVPGEPPVRVYAPHDLAEPRPCLYWLHGGGHVLGDVEQDDPLLCDVVLGTGAVCASVDRRRAPEHPFPAAVDDGYAGLRWVTASAGELGVDPARIIVIRLFLDEDVDYAQRLIRAGVSTELHVYRGAVHGFDLIAPDAEVSRRYLADRDTALARALGTRAGAG